MKKTKKYLILLTTITSILLTSCANGSTGSDNTGSSDKKDTTSTSSDDTGSSDKPDTTPITPVVFDFRIKNGAAHNSTNSSIGFIQNNSDVEIESAEEETPDAELVYETSTPEFIITNEVEIAKDEQESIFTLSADEEKGIKVIFKLPESLLSKGYTFDSINVWNCDANDNCSLRMFYYNKKGSSNKEVTLYFPYVLSESEAKLMIGAYFKKNYSLKSYGYQAKYKLNTQQGLGVIDDLPVNYAADTSHITVNDLVIKIEKVIAPEVTKANKMQKHIELYYTDATENSKRWDAETVWICEQNEAVTSEDDCYSLDFLNFFKPDAGIKRKNYFLQFSYRFTVDGYNDVYFFTPEILSDLNDFEATKQKFEEKSIENISKQEKWSYDFDYDSKEVVNFTSSLDKKDSVYFTLSEANDEQEGYISFKLNRGFYAQKGKTYRISYNYSTPDVNTKITIWDIKDTLGVAEYEDDNSDSEKDRSIIYNSTSSEIITIMFKPFSTNAKYDGNYSITDFEIEEI